MLPSFPEKTKLAQTQNQSDILLLLRPLMSEMPAPMHFQDDPFLPFSKAIITATRNVVCGYVFDFPAYMAHGAAGAIALERSIAYVGSNLLKILHGNFADINYLPMIYENALGADAATVVNQNIYTAFTKDTSHGAFIISSGSPLDTAIPTYWVDQNYLIIPNNIILRLAGENILYTGYGEDYAQQCQQAIKVMQK